MPLSIGMKRDTSQPAARKAIALHPLPYTLCPLIRRHVAHCVAPRALPCSPFWCTRYPSARGPSARCPLPFNPLHYSPLRCIPLRCCPLSSTPLPMHGHATQVIHLDKPKCTMLKTYAVSTLSGRLELQTSHPSLPWRSPCPCGYLSNCELGLTWPSASLPRPHAHEAEPDRLRNPPLLPWQTRLQTTVPRTDRGPRLPPPCTTRRVALVIPPLSDPASAR